MNPLLKLDALITADQPADASVSVYEDIIASITPSTVRFPDFLDYACTISSFTHSELLFNIVLGYIPGVSKQLANELDDDEAESLMDEVDQETRAKGHHELNHALTYCRKKLKSQSRSMNCNRSTNAILTNDQTSNSKATRPRSQQVPHNTEAV